MPNAKCKPTMQILSVQSSGGRTRTLRVRYRFSSKLFRIIVSSYHTPLLGATAGLVSMVKRQNSLRGPALIPMRTCNRAESNGKTGSSLVRGREWRMANGEICSMRLSRTMCEEANRSACLVHVLQQVPSPINWSMIVESKSRDQYLQNWSMWSNQEPRSVSHLVSVWCDSISAWVFSICSRLTLLLSLALALALSLSLSLSLALALSLVLFFQDPLPVSGRLP